MHLLQNPGSLYPKNSFTDGAEQGSRVYPARKQEAAKGGKEGNGDAHGGEAAQRRADKPLPLVCP